jgi:hypothetical protein
MQADFCLPSIALTDQLQIEITCRQVWKQISNFLDDDLSAELRERLKQHFSHCHHCRAIMNGTRNTVTLVADERAFELPEETSHRLYSRLTDFLQKK